ncbi:MAG: carbohydrate-binding domain-containing protein [Peptococcaceae bacterium]|jgi:hypothetical protein|nr:carbohydrate-binding domain-containing protein [Peptococcaceae bacterium]
MKRYPRAAAAQATQPAKTAPSAKTAQPMEAAQLTQTAKTAPSAQPEKIAQTAQFTKTAKTRLFPVAILLFAIVLAGCGQASGAQTEPPSAGEAASPPPLAPVQSTGGYLMEYAYKSEDLDSAWSETDAVTVVFTGNSAAVSGGGAAFAEGVLTVSQAGTYVLSGTLTDGQILIDAGKDDLVRLVLNGVSLNHSSGSVIYAPQAGKTVLILPKGTQNTVADGSNYTFPEGETEPDAAIFAQDDLTVTGEGALSVTGAYKHGIRSNDVLAVMNGFLTVQSAGDGLRGRDGVAVRSGTLVIEAAGDGIQSNNDEDAAKGFVILNGGTYAINAAQDGIQAESALTVTDGEFNIVTGGGAANAPPQTENARGGFGGRGRNGEASEAAASDETGVSESKKALKAGKLIYIGGGSFTVDSEDDSVHSNGDITVTAGTFTLQTGDDTFHADNQLLISGGEIDIQKCYEGLEGLSVTVSGGNISIVAADDAINAAGGNDSGAGGPMGADRFASGGDRYVRISGGALDLFAARDGIDSNGDIFLEGGATAISGPSQGMEGAVDLDGAFVVTGGTLITAGSALSPASNSTQASILVSYSAPQASGSVIALKNAEGRTLLEYTSRNAYSASAFTSPELTEGETYALYIDGEKRTDITLSGAVTAINDDGAGYTLRGGFGGGGGGGNLTPPPEGNAAPSGGAAPPENGAAPERTPAPPGDGTAPPEDGAAPPGFGERRGDFTPPGRDSVPPERAPGPPGNDTAPPSFGGGAPPEQERIITEQQDE